MSPAADVSPLSAQEVFRAILRDRVAPAMRDLGFRGSGQAYVLPHDLCWIQVGIQKNHYSTAAELEFTVNLSVVSKSAWQAYVEANPGRGPRRPSPNEALMPKTGGWRARLGHLLPEQQDTWWTVTPASDPEQVAGTIVGSIQEAALGRMLEEAAARSGNPARTSTRQ